MAAGKVTITICSSASFYRQVIESEKVLKKLGFKTKVPHVTRIMARKNDFDVIRHKTWFRDPKAWKRKKQLMDLHFTKVRKADAILVLNYPKGGFEGYIGGNGLMEMALAYFDKKPIFILNTPSETLPIYEEIIGLQPTFLEGNIENIVKHLSL